MEKSKAEESPKERKQKAGPKKKERVPFCQEKKNIPLWKWLVLAELHAGVKISIKEVPVELKFAKHAVENEISFSLCKYQPWYKNIFAVGFSFAFGNFTHYCVVLLNAPLSDLGEKKDTCLQWVTFPGKSRSIVDPRGSRCPIGLRFQEAR